jgi:hypothetical protein
LPVVWQAFLASASGFPVALTVSKPPRRRIAEINPADKIELESIANPGDSHTVRRSAPDDRLHSPHGNYGEICRRVGSSFQRQKIRGGDESDQQGREKNGRESQTESGEAGCEKGPANEVTATFPVLRAEPWKRRSTLPARRFDSRPAVIPPIFPLHPAGAAATKTQNHKGDTDACRQS